MKSSIVISSLLIIIHSACTGDSGGRIIPVGISEGSPAIVMALPEILEDVSPNEPGYQLDVMVGTTRVESGRVVSVYSDLGGGSLVGTAEVPAVEGEAMSAVFTIRLTLSSGFQVISARVANNSGRSAESEQKPANIVIDGCGLFFIEPAVDPFMIDSTGYTGNALPRSAPDADPKIVGVSAGVTDMAGCGGAEARVRVGCSPAADDMECLSVFTAVIGYDGIAIFDGANGIEFFHDDMTTIHAIAEHPTSHAISATPNISVIVDLIP